MFKAAILALATVLLRAVTSKLVMWAGLEHSTKSVELRQIWSPQGWTSRWVRVSCGCLAVRRSWPKPTLITTWPHGSPNLLLIFSGLRADIK